LAPDLAPIDLISRPIPEVALTLALAVVASSTAPLVLLDGDQRIIAASDSFAIAFSLPPQDIKGRVIYTLGSGEWDVPRLRSLITATMSGVAAIPSYEIDLKLPGHGQRRLVINASKLEYEGSQGAVRILLAIADVTDARLAAKVKDDLLREKAVLLREIQHRVANSLQIIASVLMQSARKVGSDDARVHLRDAHSRVMAIAELQRQLAESESGDVEIGKYLEQLCLSIGASMIEDHDLVKLTTTAGDSRVTANVSVSIGLVVTELVINSLKHAFPDLRPGNIVVEYRATGDDWTLKVSDDGIGMAGEADVRPGLGTSIVNALAKHLEAEVSVTDAGPGTIVALTHREGMPGDASPEEAAV
jgi:two-component sensor histidine kinase